MTGFIIRGALAALGLWLATKVFPGLRFDEPSTLIAAALLLGIVNAVIRPLVLLLTLPLTLITLGLFLLVINAGMVGLVALILDGFYVANFWTALGTSILVGIVSLLGSSLIGNNGRFEVYRSKRKDER